MFNRQLSKSTVNRQLPIRRVDGVDAFKLTRVDEVDGKVDGELTLFCKGCCEGKAIIYAKSSGRGMKSFRLVNTPCRGADGGEFLRHMSHKIRKKSGIVALDPTKEPTMLEQRTIPEIG